MEWNFLSSMNILFLHILREQFFLNFLSIERNNDTQRLEFNVLRL